MSRLTMSANNGGSLAYGLDHALGWFFQLFDANEEILIDEDTMFTGLSESRLVDLIREHGNADDVELCEGKLLLIALSLDPAFKIEEI